ncbi:MAG: aminotransferase class I/II-fold pyridoxal phosphate-dependent enzyme [Butyricimonas faecihominis]
MASRFDGIVVVDEAYIDFTDMPSAVVLQEVCRNVVVLQTLSKAWGLAGLRVGICMADPELVIYLNKVKPPYNIGSLTQRRALDVLRNEADFLEKVEAMKWGKKKGYWFLAEFILVGGCL